MRLVDADALQEEYVRLSGKELSLIDDAPTVDPVKHGHWIHKYDSWTCSECYYTFHGKPLWKYCPHCGAKNEAVLDYAYAHLDESDSHPLINVYIVWMCKALQNNKALLSTNMYDGMYYEVTYNGDKHELYLDAYKKFENKKIEVGNGNDN